MTYALLGVRIFGVLAIALIPAIAFTAAGWSGAIGVALYAVGASAAGTVVGGVGFGVRATIALGIGASAVMFLLPYPWAVAAVLVVMGGVYGYWSASGYTSGALLIPALVPYFAQDPPGVFTTASPTINAAYLAAFGLIFVISGMWTALVMSRLVLHGKSYSGAVKPHGPPTVFGASLGLVAGFVAAFALSSTTNSQWAWITLTIFLLSNPTGSMDFVQIRDRIVGTVVGLGLALSVASIHLDSAALGVISLVLVAAALIARIDRKPYWLFVTLFTPAIVLTDAVSSTTESVAEQRLLFTIMGAVIAIAVSVIANVALALIQRRRGGSSTVVM